MFKDIFKDPRVIIELDTHLSKDEEVLLKEFIAEKLYNKATIYEANEYADNSDFAVNIANRVNKYTAQEYEC